MDNYLFFYSVRLQSAVRPTGAVDPCIPSHDNLISPWDIWLQLYVILNVSYLLIFGSFAVDLFYQANTTTPH